MRAILAAAKGQYQVLYALLAGCGPMRVGEALGLEIDKHLSPDFRTLAIRQKAKAGEIQHYLKTPNGEREVDLCQLLASLLCNFVDKRTSGLLFHTASGKQLFQSNVLRDSLHPILERIGHVKGDLNIFRRFRITHLEKTGCPEALRHFWSGAPTITYPNGTQNCAKSAPIGCSGPSEPDSASSFRTELDNQDNRSQNEMRRK